MTGKTVIVKRRFAAVLEDADDPVQLLWENEHHADVDAIDDVIKVEEDR